jgi:hypothetical protein
MNRILLGIISGIGFGVIAVLMTVFGTIRSGLPECYCKRSSAGSP